MPSLRVLLPVLIGALLGRWRNERAWAEAERSIREAATLYGQRLGEQDAREQRMARLAERQVRLGWLMLAVAIASLAVAMLALVD